MPVKGKPRIEYPATVREFARRLVHEHEMTVPEVKARLEARGYVPAHNTLLAWIDPEYAVARRHANKLAQRRHARGTDATPPGHRRLHPVDQRFERMKELRDVVCLSYRAIAALMNHEWGLKLTDDQVRYSLKAERPSREVRRLLSPTREAARG